MTPTDPGTHHHYSNEEMHNEDVAYEHADISIQTLVASGIGLLAVVAVAALLMLVVFKALESQAAARDPQVSPVAATRDHQPPAPQLLTNEPGNLKNFRDEENQKLDGYAWVDQNRGVARVPIEEAKKLLVKQGIPTRSGGPEDPREGTNAPAYGEASGGRTIDIPKVPAAAAPAAPEDVKK
jgi:hypothetical protein